MRIALVHDFLVEYGGGERVLEALHQIFPQAPIYTAYFDPSGFGPHLDRLNKWNIKVSFLQKFPRALLSPLRILAPLAFESFDLSEYDVIISSCNSYFAKAVLTQPNQLHISYIHTPPRYLYGYTTSFNYKKHWWTRVTGELANHFLRLTDYETSQRPDILIANSKNVKDRIKKFYHRDSRVIYPPVDLKEFQVPSSKFQASKKDYFLSLNRLVRGKGTEVTISVCTKLELPLKVVGTGPELDSLKKMAGRNVEFLGQVSDQERIKLFAGAKALIVASEDEDFGITAVEAQAAGTSVIAIKTGGYLETVIPGKTGEFFESGQSGGYANPETIQNLIQTLERFNPESYKAEDCRANAERFSFNRFKEEILRLIDRDAT